MALHQPAQQLQVTQDERCEKSRRQRHGSSQQPQRSGLAIRQSSPARGALVLNRHLQDFFADSVFPACSAPGVSRLDRRLQLFQECIWAWHSDCTGGAGRRHRGRGGRSTRCRYGHFGPGICGCLCASFTRCEAQLERIGGWYYGICLSIRP